MKINHLYIVRQIKADRNGNRRYVVHYSAFLTREEKAAPCDPQAPRAKFNLALSKARKRGGKVYRGRGYPGGIVFQAYNEPELIAKIADVKQPNPQPKHDLGTIRNIMGHTAQSFRA